MCDVESIHLWPTLKKIQNDFIRPTHSDRKRFHVPLIKRDQKEEKDDVYSSFQKPEEMHSAFAPSKSGAFWGVSEGKDTWVYVYKSETEMEGPGTWGTVWKETQHAVCSGRSIKISTLEETAEKLRFPAEVFERHSKIPQGIGTICITMCCGFSGDPKDPSP